MVFLLLAVLISLPWLIEAFSEAFPTLFSILGSFEFGFVLAFFFWFLQFYFGLLFCYIFELPRTARLIVRGIFLAFGSFLVFGAYSVFFLSPHSHATPASTLTFFISNIFWLCAIPIAWKRSERKNSDATNHPRAPIDSACSERSMPKRGAIPPLPRQSPRGP